MTTRKLQRRQFLQAVISQPVSIPLLFILGCDSLHETNTFLASQLNPQNSLKKLILLLGPWPADQREKAENFAARFLKAEHAAGPYLSGSSRLVQSLARKFAEGTMAVKQIDLRKLPAKERALLTDLTRQLYSFVEIRLLICKEPPQGECQSDRIRYTLDPAVGRV